MKPTSESQNIGLANFKKNPELQFTETQSPPDFTSNWTANLAVSARIRAICLSELRVWGRTRGADWLVVTERRVAGAEERRGVCTV